MLFYALAALALAADHIPVWLPVGAWLFVGSRLVHSLIQCTYNRVTHRFAVFVFGYGLLLLMWLGFAISSLAA